MSKLFWNARLGLWLWWRAEGWWVKLLAFFAGAIFLGISMVKLVFG